MSKLIIPFIVLFIILYGFYKKVPLYDTFIDGAKESFEMILKLFPPLLAMVLAINILVNSNILELLNYINILKSIPSEIIPMALIRPISGTSSLAILANIYEQFTPDGYIGTLASFIQGSTDTTFYVLTLYFGSVGIKKIKYALWAGLLADLASITLSIILVSFLF